MHDWYPHASKYARCDEEPGPQPGAPAGSATVSTPTPYESKQAPRRVRLQRERDKSGDGAPARSTLAPPRPQATTGSMRRRSSAAATTDLVRNLKAAAATSPISRTISLEEEHPAPPQPVRVVCHARTRVPTPHGDVLLHLYRNDRDDKEHLAFVFDRPQLTDAGDPEFYLRSRTLDAVWRPGETNDERIVRGAYIGRLAPQHAVPSTSRGPSTRAQDETPLVRIHSECFTGETIGSQRCDCGEQLDEAFRLAASSHTGRGIVVYLRQEGRGIGLLEKLRAYNLQDLGHDTVTANLLLGHRADLRSYAVAAAILSDLGIGQVRLLTNNPDKIEQLATEGIKVKERVPMVPRTWRAHARQERRPASTSEGGTSSGDDEDVEERDARLRRSGVGMIGAGDTDSPELERYLAAKASKMGHLLERPVISQAPSQDEVWTMKRKKKGSRRESLLDEHLASSMVSLGTESSIECDAECECHQEEWE